MNTKLATVTQLQIAPRLRAGSVETVKNKRGEIIGYQGRLPRSKSGKAPAGCKNPSKYRQRVGSLEPTWEAAVLVVNEALQLVERKGIAAGQTYADFAKLELAARYTVAFEACPHPARANKTIGSWRSIDKIWLSKAPFYGSVPHSVTHKECQDFIDDVADHGLAKSGKPIAKSSVHLIAQLLKAVFKRAEVKPNPAGDLSLPKWQPKGIQFMALSHQRRFFACKDIPIADRVMVGCGMGLGLRVGELLSLELNQINFVGESRGYLTVQYGGDHHSPCKGRKNRRVELFEPGLGFLKMWLRDHYDGKSEQVFAGPNGGYQGRWQTLFPDWSKHAGRKLTSHIMRHTYAVSMMCGTWGYPMRPLGFVQNQLGHTEISTTEKYYATYEAGTWSRDVDSMVGGAPEASPEARAIVTAEALLAGSGGLSSGLSTKSKRGTNTEQKAETGPPCDNRWSTNEFPGSPEVSEEKAACDRPLRQAATVARFAPRRRRRPGGA